LYVPPDIIRVIKSSMMRWAGQALERQELENLEGRDCLEDLGTAGKILEWILRK